MNLLMNLDLFIPDSAHFRACIPVYLQCSIPSLIPSPLSVPHLTKQVWAPFSENCSSFQFDIETGERGGLLAVRSLRQLLNCLFTRNYNPRNQTKMIPPLFSVTALGRQFCCSFAGFDSFISLFCSSPKSFLRINNRDK